MGDAESDGTSRTEILHTTCGTPNYVAPEVLADQGYDGKKADVWSIGVILYVLLAGFLPFDEATIVNLFSKIQNADFTYPSWFSPEVRSVLDLMLVADPKVRSSLTKLKSNEWLRSCIPSWGAEAESATAAVSSAVIVETTGGGSGGGGGGEGAAGARAASGSGSGGQDWAEFDDDADAGAENGVVRRPKVLNAFDLVSQCGGFLLDRLFSPQTFREGSISSRGSPGATDNQHGGGALWHGGAANRRTSNFHFSSPIAPPGALIEAVYRAMVEMGFEIDGAGAEAAKSSGRMKGSLLTAKGMLGIGVQVYELCSTLTLLELRRGKGDLMEWSAAYNDLVDNRIAHLINKPVSEETKSEVASSVGGGGATPVKKTVPATKKKP